MCIIYTNEADVLNVALFGITAKPWREVNPDLKGNIRDYAAINELICLSNMENLNAVFINEKIPQNERLIKLNKIAIQQISILQDVQKPKLLTGYQPTPQDTAKKVFSSLHKEILLLLVVQQAQGICVTATEQLRLNIWFRVGRTAAGMVPALLFSLFCERFI